MKCVRIKYGSVTECNEYCPMECEELVCGGPYNLIGANYHQMIWLFDSFLFFYLIFVKSSINTIR